MPEYRLYLLDSEGHIRRALDINCPDDSAAIQTAEDHDRAAAKELWQGARMVRTFPAHVGHPSS